jgi:hypothetical protein
MAHRALFASLIVWIALGCAPFDTTRVPAPRGTLGEEIVRVFCERMASEAHPEDVTGLAWRPVCRGDQPPPADAPLRMRVLLENRARLAAAIDRALPETTHDDLGHFVGQLLPLHDPPLERVPRNTRLLAQFLDVLSSDRAALDAMARVGTRSGYRPQRLGLGVVRPALAYPELDTFAGTALRTITDDPADATDGVAAAEWRDLQRALALELASLEPAAPLPPGERSNMDLTRELLFTEDAGFSAGGPPRWALVRDPRGLALPAGGLVSAPLADLDGDGFADVDGMGRFVDSAGTVAVIPAPFRVLGEAGIARDPSGRAIRSDATRYWEYRDIDRTMLAGVLREAGPMFDPAEPSMLLLSRGLPLIMGPDTTLTETYGSATLSYPGPDTSRGSLFEVVYALAQVLPRDETDRALALTVLLLRDHPDELAGLLGAAHHMIVSGDADAGARLEQPSVFWDELIEMAIDYAQQPGLLDALMRSFADPRSARLGEVYGAMMRNRDRVDFDPADVNGDPVGLPLDEPVDRATGDVRGNESVFQRTLALIDGLNGVRVCNREGAVMRLEIGPLTARWPLIGGAGRCEIIDIPNVAEAYALSILGQYELELQDPVLSFITSTAASWGIPVDRLIQDSAGITGMTRFPTPQALNRLVFYALDLRGEADCEDEDNPFAACIFDRIRDRHGNDVIDTYGGTIFAWEAPGFYEGMTPLLEVLHDPRWRYDAAGRYRFGDMLGRMHRHWATPEHWLTQSTNPSGPNFSHQSGARRYEEIVAHGFADPEGRILARMQVLQAALDATDVEPGRDGIRVLAEAAQALIDPARNPGLATRDGRASIPWNDGSDTFEVTPLLLVLDAMRAMDRDLAADPARRTEWETGRDALAEQLLGARRVGDGYQMANPRSRALLLHLVPWLRARLADHRARGDLAAWSADLVPDTEDALSSPAIAGLVRFLDAAQDDPDARTALAGLLAYLVDEASGNDAFASALYAGSDLLQVIEDDENIVPIGHALALALAPNAADVVAGRATELDLDGAVASDALGLARAIQGVDDRRTLRVLLSGLVSVPTDGSEEVTPLEEILDVLSLINRVTPGDGGAYVADDYAEAMGQTRGFLLDERRGMERLYDVVQNRELP